MNKWTYIILLVVVLYYAGRYFYFRPKFDNGQKAVTFTAVLVDGTSFNLESMNGKYVLLDFWGSWCGPCRNENAGIVDLYKNYHGQKYTNASDFEIISIGVENNDQQWKRAIAQDGLSWPYHILQNKSFNSPIPSLYGVKSIPTKYLLDKNGEIVLVNPDVNELKQYLDSNLVR